MIKSKSFSDRIKCIISWLILYKPIQWCLKKILDEEIKPLHETKVFILGISVPITATIFSFGLLIWTTGRHRNFNFSNSGFAEFFEIYRFPLWVLVGTVALTALSVALHRSRETAKQIELSSKQYQAVLEKNNFENYIKHQEHFDKLLNQLNNIEFLSGTLSIAMKNTLYKRFFPENNYMYLNTSLQRHDLLKNYEIAINIIENLSNPKASTSEEDIIKIAKINNYLIKNLNIKFNYEKNLTLNTSERSSLTFGACSESELDNDPYTDIKNFINTFNSLISITYKILNFTFSNASSPKHLPINAPPSNFINTVLKVLFFSHK